MRELKYFATALSSLACVLGLYFLLLDTWLIPDSPKIGFSYKQFLLENCPGPKIVVDSGSNSHFGINSEILSEKLGLPVINISDNASYPLSSRYHRYDKYLEAGDTLILPLEWRYYYTDYKPIAFYSSIYRENIFYYRNSPVHHRAFLVFTTPYYLIMEQLGLKPSAFTSEFYDKQLRDFDSYLEYNQSGDVSFETMHSTPSKETFSTYTWDLYTLGYSSSIGDLSSSCIQFFEKLQNLSRKGVKIIVVPPALVSPEAYNGFEDNLDNLCDQISKLAKKTNISYLYNYQDYAYPLEAGFDTYYHLNPKYRDIRTNRLLKDISSFFMNQDVSPNFDKSSYFRNALHKKLHVNLLNLENLSEPTIGKEFWIRNDLEPNTISFDPNWYPIGQGGVWAKKGLSSIFLEIPDTTVSHIEILGLYYDPPRTTEVTINGHAKGDFDLSQPQLIPLDGNHGIIKIGLLNEPSISPFSKMESEDRRKLSLGIRRLKLVPAPTN